MSKKHAHRFSFVPGRDPDHSPENELLGILYEKHLVYLTKYVIRILRYADKTEVDDVVSETFQRALMHPVNISKVNDPTSWLFGIAKNICWEVIRKRTFFESLEDVEDAISHSTEDYSLELDAKELEELIMEVKVKLPERQRLYIRHFWREGLSVTEIANLYQVTRQNVSNQLLLARRKIDDHLMKHGINFPPKTQK